MPFQSASDSAASRMPRSARAPHPTAATAADTAERAIEARAALAGAPGRPPKAGSSSRRRSLRPALQWLRRATLAALFGTALLTAACEKSQPAFTNLDISGNQSFASDFALPDTDGKMRTLADYRGRVVVLVFGYTHCPDVCPATLAELAQAMQQLGNDAKRIQVVFVSVDPQRDTAPVLAQYVHAFDPSFIALRPADRVQLDAVTKAFKIYYSRNAPQGAAAASAPATGASAPAASSAGEAGGYTVDHTAASLVFDREGKLRLYARDAQGAGPWVHDLKLLLDEKK